MESHPALFVLGKWHLKMAEFLSTSEPQHSEDVIQTDWCCIFLKEVILMDKQTPPQNMVLYECKIARVSLNSLLEIRIFCLFVYFHFGLSWFVIPSQFQWSVLPYQFYKQHCFINVKILNYQHFVPVEVVSNLDVCEFRNFTPTFFSLLWYRLYKLVLMFSLG